MMNSFLHQQVLLDAQRVWEFHLMHQPLRVADCMLLLGSNDKRVATYAAELFHKCFAPNVLVTGGIAHRNDLLATNWGVSEAEMFSTILRDAGVPDERIIQEQRAQNTAENFFFSKGILRSARFQTTQLLVVTKPAMEKRAFYTGRQVLPEFELTVTSPQLGLFEYANNEHPLETVINIIVGDLQRLRVYAERGYQCPVEIPTDVLDAYDRLIASGYTRHLVSVF